MGAIAVGGTSISLACGPSTEPGGDEGSRTAGGYRITHSKTIGFSAQPIADCTEFHGDPAWAVTSTQEEGPCPSAQDRALCAACFDVPGGTYADLGVAYSHRFYYEDLEGGCGWLTQNIVDACLVFGGGRYETYHGDLIEVASTTRPDVPGGVPLVDLGALAVGAKTQ